MLEKGRNYARSGHAVIGPLDPAERPAPTDGLPAFSVAPGWPVCRKEVASPPAALPARSAHASVHGDEASVRGDEPAELQRRPVCGTLWKGLSGSPQF